MENEKLHIRYVILFVCLEKGELELLQKIFRMFIWIVLLLLEQLKNVLINSEMMTLL